MRCFAIAAAAVEAFVNNFLKVSVRAVLSCVKSQCVALAEQQDDDCTMHMLQCLPALAKQCLFDKHMTAAERWAGVILTVTVAAS